jgi:hypothetical protein
MCNEVALAPNDLRSTIRKENMKTLKGSVMVAVVIVGVLGLSAGSLKAQDATPSSDNKKVELGARFMPTVSNFEMRNAEGEAVKGQLTFGYGVGVFVGVNFTPHVGLQGEIIYNSVSQRYKEQDSQHRVNLRYVNIPLLFSLNTGKSRRVNGNLVVGPQIGISAGGEVKTSDSGSGTTVRPLVVVKAGDIGLAYGAGVDFGLNPSSTLRLGVGFRGVYGFLDISDDSNAAETDSYLVLDRTHVKTYSAYAGLSFLF